MYLFQLCVHMYIYDRFLECLWILYSASNSCFWLTFIQANLRVQLLVRSIKCLLHSMYHSAIKVLLWWISNNWKSQREKNNSSTWFLLWYLFLRSRHRWRWPQLLNFGWAIILANEKVGQVFSGNLWVLSHKLGSANKWDVNIFSQGGQLTENIMTTAFAVHVSH